MRRRYHIVLFVFFICFLTGCGGDKTYVVKTETITLDSLQQVVPLSDSLVQPILYKNVTGFDKLDKEEGKPTFIAAMLPSILVAKHNVETVRRKIFLLKDKETWTRDDSAVFNQARLDYAGKSVEELLLRITTLPNSIILAQAAVESGWGQSRFFTEARNVFGIWSFDEKDQRIAAGQTRNEKIVYLRSYEDLSGSVSDYFKVLSRSGAFKSLRRARRETDDPFVLVHHLKRYSERKGAYTNLLSNVIRQNHLDKYDKFVIDERFLEEED